MLFWRGGAPAGENVFPPSGYRHSVEDLTPRQKSDVTKKIGALKKRSEFVKATRHGRKWVADTVIVQQVANQGTVRLGVTATKKLGGAVVRNRVKRRLRHAFKDISCAIDPGAFDYVLIGRNQTLSCSYACLLDDVKTALVSLRRLDKRQLSRKSKKGAQK